MKKNIYDLNNLLGGYQEMCALENKSLVAKVDGTVYWGMLSRFMIMTWELRVRVVAR